MSNWSVLARAVRRRRRVPPGRVAIVRLYGVIAGGARSADWLDTVRHLRDAKRVPAVVVDIDSPGGSAAASDYLYLALARLAAAKPVVAHVRGSGASGAYLAALAGRRLVVAPQSLVGSIGVISAGPRIGELLTRAGIRVAETRAGRLKGLGVPWRDGSDEERAKERELVEAYYERFVERVSAARRIELERARELATGEVWLGSRAVELGLADEVGDLDRAVEIAAEFAGVPPKAVRVRARRPVVARLLDRFAARLASSVLDDLESRVFGAGPRL